MGGIVSRTLTLQPSFNCRKLEAILGYRFRDLKLLKEACTHCSWPDQSAPCYQRLEFLGDAALDFLVSRYYILGYRYANLALSVTTRHTVVLASPLGLHQPRTLLDLKAYGRHKSRTGLNDSTAANDCILAAHDFKDPWPATMCRDIEPGKLHDLRSASVNNTRLAIMTAWFKLHPFLRCFSTRLFGEIAAFVGSVKDAQKGKLPPQLRSSAHAQRMEQVRADLIDLPAVMEGRSCAHVDALLRPAFQCCSWRSL